MAVTRDNIDRKIDSADWGITFGIIWASAGLSLFISLWLNLGDWSGETQGVVIQLAWGKIIFGIAWLLWSIWRQYSLERTRIDFQRDRL